MFSPRKQKWCKQSTGMKNIHKVVQQHGWKLEVSWYAFGGGYFVYVTPYKWHSSDFTGLTHLPNTLSLEAKWMYHLIHKDGAWLPIAYAETLNEGVRKLEEKLEGKITQEWLDRVQQAYDEILLLFKESAETQAAKFKQEEDSTE